MKHWRRVVIWIGAVLVAFCFVYCVYPSLFIAEGGHPLATTIVDHRLPKLRRWYRHEGKPEIVISSCFMPDEAMTNSVYTYWCKVYDKDAEQKKSIWNKVCDCVAQAVRFMSFDEKGAFVITDRKYEHEDELAQGKYTYLGAVRVTLHVEMLGTGVWEFPIYVDNHIGLKLLSGYMRGGEGGQIKELRSALYQLMPPERSYQIKLLPRGAMLMFNLQPWVCVSCELSLEYMGDGAFASGDAVNFHPSR